MMFFLLFVFPIFVLLPAGLWMISRQREIDRHRELELHSRLMAQALFDERDRRNNP